MPWWAVKELEEGGQKVQTSSYKVSAREVIYNMITMGNTAV